MQGLLQCRRGGEWSGAPVRTGHVSADANEQEMHLRSKLVSAGWVIAI